MKVKHLLEMHFKKFKYGLLLIAGAMVIGLASFSGKQTIAVYDFDSFEPYLHMDNDTTYVINFWATWCVPCREELPALEEINKNYASKKVKVLLVSLDFPSQVNSRLIPFIEEYGLKSEVILLDDPDSNSWIPKVDDSWTGSIPATVIYNKGSRTFHEKVFTYEELETIVKSKLNTL